MPYRLRVLPNVPVSGSNVNAPSAPILLESGVYSRPPLPISHRRLSQATAVYREGYDYTVDYATAAALAAVPGVVLIPMGLLEPELVPTYFDTAILRPDGLLGYTTQSGHLETDGGGQPTVLSKAVYNNNFTPGTTYRFSAHGTEVDWVGTTFGFTNGTGSGTISLGGFSNTNLGDTALQSSMHIAITDVAMAVQVIGAGSGSIVTAWSVSYPSLANFGIYTAEVMLDKIRGRAKILDPYGRVFVVEDARFKNYTSKIAFFEHVLAASQRQPFYIDRWAGFGGQRSVSS